MPLVRRISFGLGLVTAITAIWLLCCAASVSRHCGGLGCFEAGFLAVPAFVGLALVAVGYGLRVLGTRWLDEKHLKAAKVLRVVWLVVTAIVLAGSIFMLAAHYEILSV